MKKWVIFIMCFCIVVGGLFMCFLLSNKQYVAIQQEGAYFNMTSQTLLRLKGNPVEVYKNAGDTPSDIYVFQEEVYGYPAIGDYRIFRGGWKEQLIEVSFQISDLTLDEAQKICNQIYESVKAEYSDHQDFYNSGVQTDGVSYLKLECGTDTGATGISYDFNYEGGELSISALRLF
ncbi:Uncharacterised protein [uncultured Ruminococcus sp.]|uniref:Uncharacterized protein n=1 Tax=Massiliimalia timonensis TaxID=1987501 RepID=A0A8J6TVR2_9FIRM|nr:hypothetical protein [Massiliimalia timonensis]MBC8611608.1 hypothetical protein [Massiliimalia timonensis]SCH56118.1 Uncharacterised protein [uncultured Clostridium sp.]SCH67840.1 Uncharacterised protein [uncultured Ruminococcus sp.]